MDDVDMYNYLLVNHDGTIAYVIRQTKPHIVLFDPAEERKNIIGPLTTKGEDTIDLHRGSVEISTSLLTRVTFRLPTGKRGSC